MQNIADVLSILANLATVLGIPFAIFLFIQEKRRERRDREYSIYDSLDEKYTDFLKLCLENPDIDVFDVSNGGQPELNKEQKNRELVLFTILISILERAFLMYRDQSNQIKKAQWTGWAEYMAGYSARQNFRAAWQKVGSDQFDQDFVKYIEGLMAGQSPARPEVPAAQLPVSPPSARS